MGELQNRIEELESIGDPHGSRITVLRWFTRIWGLLAVLFIGYFLLMHLLDNGGGSMRLDGAFEIFRFLCFPIGLVAGLALGLKSELWGGSLATASILAFYLGNFIVLGNAEFDWLLTGLAFPGFLYLLVWSLQKGRN